MFTWGLAQGCMYNTHAVMTDRPLGDPGADMAVQLRDSSRTHDAGSRRWPLLHLATRNRGSGRNEK